MLRTALRSQLRLSSCAHTRSFVSTVLLGKTWENESHSNMRKEAKRRGLSPQGSKATLITRLRMDDEQKALTPAPSVSPQASQQMRRASTAPEVPGVPSSSDPHPLPASYPKEFLDVKLPDLSKPHPEKPIQIPFLPDLWDSSRIKAESAPKSSSDASAPKMVAVAGSATHHGGGPTYNLSNFEDDDSIVVSEHGPSGFWRDLADDLNLPTSLTLSSATKQTEGLFDVAEKTETPAVKNYSRTLDRDEVKGVWVLLGLLAGSWVAAGYFSAPSAFAEAENMAGQLEEHAEGGH